MRQESNFTPHSGQMIRVPIPYEPVQVRPQLSTRIRREVNTVDTVNARFVEAWQTDSPRPQGGIEGRGGRIGQPIPLQSYDMNPTSSHLYLEKLISAPSNQPQSDTTERTAVLNSIRVILKAIEMNPDSTELQSEYKALIQRLKQSDLDTLSQNPYFEKYDVASDSRNIVRELRGSVNEDIVNRGESESRRLLERTMQGRWSSASAPPSQDLLFAYELMRPRVSDTTKVYRS